MITNEDLIRFAMCGVNAEMKCFDEKQDAQYIEQLKELDSELSKLYNSMSEKELVAEFKY